MLREKGVKSLLGVPLVYGNEVLGVLHVGTFSPRDFTPEDVDLLEVVATTASIGIAHARLFAAEREARMRLERLEAVTDAALAHLQLDELLAELLARTRDLLETDTAAVLLLDEAENELVARSAVGLRRRSSGGSHPRRGRVRGTHRRERHPIVLDDVDHADVLNPVLREKGSRACSECR